MFVGRLLLVCDMKKFLILTVAISQMTFNVWAEGIGPDIVVVDYSVVFAKCKAGRNVSEKISKILSTLRSKFADLEEQLKLSESRKSHNSKSSHVVFDKNIDFDAKAYRNSSEKDKHLMLYTLAQRKSNEVSDIAAQGEKNLRCFIKETITKVAMEMKVKLVLDKSAVVYADKSIVDITNKVIKQADIDIAKFKYPKGMEKVK